MEPSRPAVSVTPGVLIGWLLPCAIGATAWGVGLQFPVLGAPVVAILIGLVVGQVFGQRKEWAAGVKFASKRVLQTAIVLLGAGMSLGQVARIGGAGLPVMLGTLALFQTWFQNRQLPVEQRHSTVWYRLIPPRSGAPKSVVAVPGSRTTIANRAVSVGGLKPRPVPARTRA